MMVGCLCLFLFPRGLYRVSQRLVDSCRDITGLKGAGNGRILGQHRRLYQTRADILTSAKGSTIQHVRKLLQKPKYRYEQSKVVVENPKLIADLYTNPVTRSLIRQILVDTKRWEETPSDWSFLQQGDFSGDDSKSFEVIHVAPAVMKACSDTVNNQGMLAVCDMPAFDTEEFLSTKQSFTLVLDGVSDPGNLGTLIRSAAATNVKDIVLLPGSCDPWNPKAIRSAAATTFLLPIISLTHNEWHRQLIQRNVPIKMYAATMSNGETASTAHTDVDWTSADDAMGLILGNEGAGLSNQVQAMMSNDINYAVKAVYVPMMNEAVESLNVAVCGSVILFERARQLSQTTTEMHS